MELITPSVEIWEQNNGSLDGIWAHIARCTRVCYQSTPKENGETNEEFVKRVILRISNGDLDWDKIHGAMLENGTVYLTLPITNVMCDEVNLDITGISRRYRNNKYSKVVISDKYVYVTTNLRVIYENNWLEDLEYIDRPTFHHKRVTVSFTTNIGVTREFNRHRVNSIAEESTRYCNYNKRNDGQVKIGLPAWLLDDENMGYIEHHADDDLYSYCEDIVDKTAIGADGWCDIDYYLFALTCAEYCYNNLIAKGWKPQQAREVLPLANKSQLIHTAFVDDWIHFFKLRAFGVSGPPHPNAKLVARPLVEQFEKLGYITPNANVG